MFVDVMIVVQSDISSRY